MAYMPIAYGTAGLKDTCYSRAGSTPSSLFVFQPPFVMEKWTVGIIENQTVECTVTYEVSLVLGRGGR